jgi:hypothetical protein
MRDNNILVRHIKPAARKLGIRRQRSTNRIYRNRKIRAAEKLSALVN